MRLVRPRTAAAVVTLSKKFGSSSSIVSIVPTGATTRWCQSKFMIVDPDVVESQSFGDIGKVKDDLRLAEWTTGRKGKPESVREPAARARGDCAGVSGSDTFTTRA